MKIVEVIIAVVIIAGIIILFMQKDGGGCGTKEHYRDPIFLNRSKLMYDWYPKSNGSIYGYPYSQGGSWSIFSGYPYYDTAY
jgi:uncharacterized membrane protein